jgi:rhamnogalacturonan endolyase
MKSPALFPRAAGSMLLVGCLAGAGCANRVQNDVEPHDAGRSDAVDMFDGAGTRAAAGASPTSGAAGATGSAGRDDAGMAGTTGTGGGASGQGGNAGNAGTSGAGGINGVDRCSASSAGGSSAFGVTNGSKSFTISSGGGLTYVVQKTDGSITSINWNGMELSDAGKGSQIASGLGTATVTSSVANDVSLITATAVNAVSSTGTVIQYMATRRNENTIYLATYTTAEPDVGELRWITRLKGNILTGVAAPSNNTGTSGPIESTDINGYADGHTTSKYYGNDRAKDLSIRGVTGTGVGVFMIYGSREGSSGGPFFRDIQNQSSTAADSELYNYMNSGHNQTEADRMGLHGPYALRFTTGCTPALPEFSWISTLNLTGWVASRGTVAGAGISGMDGTHTYLVGFANTTAQYWVAVDPSTGALTSPNMQPGTYAVTVYKGELGVWTGSIAVTAGATADLAAIAITADPSRTPAIWRIGDWDGTPLEFNNGASIGLMHPSDVRMNGWGPVTYTVGTSVAGSFPAVQFRGDNTPTTVKFNLSASQVAAHTLRIGITSAYAGGRPALMVNSWTSSTPAASLQPDSRSITIGTYRGNNMTYTYDVPASAFVSGANTLTIDVASGSSDLSAWLSASWSYDCLDLD